MQLCFDSEPTRRRHWKRSVLSRSESRVVEKACDPFFPRRALTSLKDQRQKSSDASPEDYRHQMSHLGSFMALSPLPCYRTSSSFFSLFLSVEPV